jgi:iron complex outermembrane recepter protein
MSKRKTMKFYQNLQIAVVLLTFFSCSLHGQEKQSIINGFVFNTENEPAEYSTVVLMNQDSVFMKGALSGPDGGFLFDKLGAGTYRIMIRNVEFNTYVSDPIRLSGRDRAELERIQLVTRLNDLEEVVIKGEKAMVEVHPDKMVVNVSASANAAGNNALELIGKSPGVVVDMDKNIVLQGKSGVQIYINGRPSRISGADLSSMLESMPSEEIESIELITNPSAKYDAEGTAGIINIIMKSNPNAGFNGRLLGNYSIGEKPRSGAGTSLNYSNDKINMFSSINLSDNVYYSTNYNTKQRGDYLLTANDASPTRNQGINFAAGMDYQLNQEHSLSLDARVLLNEQADNMESNTSIEDLTGMNDLEILVAEATENAQSNNMNANLNYAFKPNRSTSFSADVSYGIFSRENTTLQPNDYYNSDRSVLLRSVDSRFSTATDIDIFSVKTDFEKRLSRVTISAGAKYSYINTDNSLATYHMINDALVLDEDQSNDFSYLEKIAAAYGMVNARLNEKLSLNVGLRVENTSSLGQLLTANPGPEDVVPRNYTSLFPNVSLAYNDQENHALSVSVGRRITRPNYQNLNPFEWKTSELSSWRGNPFLEPNYIQNYQVSYSFRRKLVVSNTYSVTNNFFANVFLGDGEKGNVLGPQNLDKAINNGLSVSYPLTVAKWWQFSTFFQYNYESYGGDVEGAVIDVNANIFNFRIQNNLRLPLGFQMELTGYYTSPWIWRGSVNVDGYFRINTGLRRSFLDDKLMLQASVNDLFDTGSDYYYRSDYGGMIVDGVIFFDGRRFAVSASYNFGNQQLKARRSKSALDEELKRLSD